MRFMLKIVGKEKQGVVYTLGIVTKIRVSVSCKNKSKKHNMQRIVVLKRSDRKNKRFRV